MYFKISVIHHSMRRGVLVVVAKKDYHGSSSNQ